MSPLVSALIIIVAQLGGGPDTPAPDAASLETMAKATLAKVEKLRGQKLEKPLKMGVKSRAEVTKFIQARLEEEYGEAKVRAEGQMLALQGLLPPDFDYGAYITQLLTEQVAGFYDHTRQELHIADWLPAFLQEPVMAHEIFHAIQDQMWGGGKLIDSKKYSHDEVLAHAALLEGDATIVMLDYQQGGAVDAATMPMMIRTFAATLPMQMASPQFPVMAAAPDYLKQSLIFPYQQGMLFVAGIRNNGLSRADLRKVYDDPPASTEQILHPERYHPNRDAPSKVTLPDPLLPGFERTWDGVMGEFHLRQLLQTQRSQVDAMAEAEGWDGDFGVLEVKGEQRVSAVRSIWDDEAEAEAFEKALKAVHAKRPAPKPSLALERRGREVGMAWSNDAALARRALQAAFERGQVKPVD